MKKTILFALIISAVNLFAAPYNGQLKKFKQPNGTFVDVKLFGTEYYMRAEGLDGYTLVRDKTTKWVCYAELSKDGGELISTGIVYKGKSNDATSFRSDLPFAKHIDISTGAKSALIEKNKNTLEGADANNRNGSPNSINGTPIHTVSGNIKGLCIVVDFSDEPATLPISEYENFCNDLNYSNFGNNGSLRTYYSDISGGILDYENVVYGIYRAPKTFAQYDAMPYAQGAQQILGLALNWIKSQGFDFSTLTINSNNTIQAMNLMYTGNPPTWAEGMWHHKGYYSGFSSNGVYSGDYNCSPANQPLELGVVAHENGHMIGKWPDTYKYDSSEDGIGTFDLMCAYGNIHNPVPPNPLFRSNVGWGKVIDVTNYNGINYDTANSMICYKYKNVNDTNEFFLLENRMKTDRSESIPDEGLTIWHIDRNGDNQTSNHEVYLVPANDDNTDLTGACFHLGAHQEYSNTTVPDSKFYNGSASGLRIWDIATENNILTYKLGAGQSIVWLDLQYLNLNNDNNTNGSIEPSESATLTINVNNYGQINSGTATVTCTATGTNAGYVTVNTLPVNVGVISASQTIQTNFNISISANTPEGTPLDFQFIVSDGTNTASLTKSIVVGIPLLMSSQQSTTCSAVFYDQGGENDYSGFTNITKTILPGTNGQVIRVIFSSFNIEDGANCANDFLKIYDGNSTSSPLIGTYCGAIIPDTIISTHSTGALTFKFHSDEANQAPGWLAVINCVEGQSNNNKVKDIAENNSIEIYPNPSNGIFNVNFDTPTDYTLSVTNGIGKEILIQKTENAKKTTVNLYSKANGIYLIRINTGNEFYTKKIVLNKQ